MLIDLHCHTTRSQDSRLPPKEAVAEARLAGLDAICFTEHDYLWPTDELNDVADGFPVLRGVEVSTEIGHVLAFGLTEYHHGLRTFQSLVTAAERAGAALVLAHPYRRFFRFGVPGTIGEADVTLALRKRGIDRVHGIEAGNGATRPIENELAAHAARRLVLPTTSGSDAHAPGAIGNRFTHVDDDINDPTELATAIIEGRVSGRWE